MILADLPIFHIEPRYSKQRPSDLVSRWLHINTNYLGRTKSSSSLIYLPTYLRTQKKSLPVN